VNPGPHQATRSHPDDHPPWRKWTLVLTATLGYSLGAIGFWLHARAHNGQGYPLDAMYHALQLFALHAPPVEPPINLPLEIGRWLAASSTVLWVIAVTHQLFWPGIQSLQLRRYAGHVVVCGVGPTALALVRRLRTGDPPEQVVLVAPSADTELIDGGHAAGAIVLVGRPSALLEPARLAQAAKLVAICGDDSLNVEIAARARTIPRSPEWPAVLQCQVQISDVDLRGTMRQHRLLASSETCVVRTFDYFSDAARDVLLNRLPLDHDGIAAGDPRQVHLAIVGFGSMGRTVAVRAAQLGHFANLTPMRISVIDQQASLREQELLFRFPNFRKACAIRFYDCAVQSLPARSLLEQWADESWSAFSVAVCLDDDAIGLDVAMRLRRHLEGGRVRVALRMSRGDGLTSLLGGSDLAGLPLRPFGWLDADAVIRPLEMRARDRLARMIHGEFLKRARDQHRAPRFEEALQEWETLTNEDMRQSNYQQADHIAIKLRAIGCEEAAMSDSRPAHVLTPDEVERLAEVEHRRWMAERWLAGWTLVPDKEKNEAQRTSPSLVPWEALDDITRDYDRGAVLNIPTALAVAEQKKVCRRAPAFAPAATA
jgi:hypothetical protein